MCGIFGLITNPGSHLDSNSIRNILEKVAILSESRGKDSAGIAICNSKLGCIDVLKGDVPIRDLLIQDVLQQKLANALKTSNEGRKFTAFGHARLVTNGSQLNEVNNQPVLKDDLILIHNGIIVNVDALWQKHTDIKRMYSIDTEIINSLLRKHLQITENLVIAVQNTFKELEGTYSIACMFQDLNQFILATNTGSLYYISDNQNYFIFASEAYFLNLLMKTKAFTSSFTISKIQQILPDNGLVIDLDTINLQHFSNSSGQIQILQNKIPHLILQKHLIDNQMNKREVVIDPSAYIDRSKESHLYNLLEKNSNSINKLRRCSKCLLPESFPFIEYDHEGVCNYCRNYHPKKLNSTLDVLKTLVEPYKSKNASPDCIVPFSGGRDSTYSLHIIKKELGLNPIAFTYDWGMVTDLARRNIARVCGKLGVENIIVSADIHWKRENIRKNITAWLKSPDLGMIPLFMAGDKYFFYYTEKVKKQTGIDLNIWGINHLENTEFKTGFAGLAPNFNKKRIYSLSLLNQAKLFGFVGKNILKSPGYLNQSVFDSLGSFAARYIAPKKDYYHLFDYYPWNEQEINALIKDEYQWETAIDTKSTWRIGDGTASFYNYIYYTVAGFSENDTFRSNQIREGMLSREQAMVLLEEDNLPRYETLRWYLEIIGLDFETVIKRINQIPKLYPR